MGFLSVDIVNLQNFLKESIIRGNFIYALIELILYKTIQDIVGNKRNIGNLEMYIFG